MPLLSHHATVKARTPLDFNSAARAARSWVLTGAPSDGERRVGAERVSRARGARQEIRSRREGAMTLRALVADLVAIDSVNPELVPGGAGEMEIARFIAGWLEAAGVEARIDEIAPGRANVIAVARGTGGGRTLLL